jgi:hypothetical protein
MSAREDVPSHSTKGGGGEPELWEKAWHVGIKVSWRPVSVCGPPVLGAAADMPEKRTRWSPSLAVDIGSIGLHIEYDRGGL